jgi:glucokinase
MTEVIIAVDVGGTRLRAARFDRELNMLARQETLTLAHEGFQPTLERLMHLVRGVFPDDGTSVLGIGVCIPGPTNPYTGVIELGTNLAGWNNVPLKQLLEDAFGCPVYLGNDANVAALAEVALGAARGYRHAVFITVSTGIGGGVIIDGRMLLGSEGLAAEVGHTIILVDGERISTLEKEAAGPALARQARERLAAGAESAMRATVGGDLSRITGSVVGRAAVDGDAVALEIAERAGRILGLGIVSLLHLFNPEIVVLGGGVAFGLGDLLLKPTRAMIEQYTIDNAYWQRLKIVLAGLGEDVSLFGSAALVATRGGVEDVTAAVRKLDAE